MKEPRSNKLNVRVDDALLAKLTAMAEQEDRPMASLLAVLLKEAVAEREAKAAPETQAAPKVQAAPEKKAARRAKL